MISFESGHSVENYYCESFFKSPIREGETIVEEIQKGNHQAVMNYLREGGSLNDSILYSYSSLAYVCFESLESWQIQEILSMIPEDEELPLDSARWIEDDDTGEQINRFLELLPVFEKKQYPFEFLFERLVCNRNLVWIDFFLSHPIRNLDLNLPIRNNFHMDVHPYVEMKMFEGQIAFSIRMFESFVEESDLEEVQRELNRIEKQIEQILRHAENHPKIDFPSVQEEMDRLRQKGFYFVGDPKWEKDLNFFVDARTFEGLEKHVAQGFDLYESIGPFFMNLGSGFGDCSWIELLCFTLGYEEYELVDLMVKYHPL